MNESHYYRNRRAFDSGQSRWDNASPPDDESMRAKWAEINGIGGED